MPIGWLRARPVGGYRVAVRRSTRTAKRVTLREVAEEAGVSVGMASRVLSNYGSFSAKTQSAVMAAAEQLDYRPNALARSLRVGRTKAIGVVVSNIVSYHWTTFIRGIEAAAQERGYQVLLGTTADDPAVERRYLKALQERNVDGIVLSPAPENEGFVAKLIEDGVRMVLVECANPELKAPRINIDDRPAAQRATEYLLALGHRRIGIVAGNQALSSGRRRLAGYRDALNAAGLGPDDAMVGLGEYRYEPAYRAVESLMALPDPPTALLVCNELMTGAALQCLKDRGVDVPGSVSVVAFDDPAWTSFMRPGITTVRTPRVEMARLALHTMLAMLSDPSGPAAAPTESIVTTEFVVRESCRSVRQ